VLAAQQAKLRALKKAFTFAFWELPDVRKQPPRETSDGTFVMVDGIEVCFKPDRFLTDDQMAQAGGTFKHQGLTAGAETTVTYEHLAFDPTSIQQMDLGAGQYMVTDYTEPVLTIAIQVTYRKSRKARTLEAARGQISAYGKGRTLRDHEAAHVADAISFIRSVGPRLPNGRGIEARTFNQMIKAYYAASLRVGADFGDYSQARTDCPGRRNASFCPVVKRK